MRRVVFESEPLRAGAEKLDGKWLSAGREIEGRPPEDLLDRLSRAEVRRFVAAKDLATIGLAPVRRRKPVPEGSVEILLEKLKDPTRVEVFATPELAAEGSVAARVTGRGDFLVVDAAVWDDVRTFAGLLKTAASAPAATAVPSAAPSAESP